MNQIEQLYQSSDSFSDFAVGYFDYLRVVLSSVNSVEVDKLAAELMVARQKRSTIFVAGNGGSAATANTMANDLGFDVLKKTGTELPLRVVALTANPVVMSAIANDTGYENVFVNQLKVHYRAEDVLIVISASGNSPNVIEAARWVKRHGGQVIGLLGFSGGQLKEMCDVTVHFKTASGEYGPTEDAHLIMNHVLSHWLQGKLKDE